ncbi:MAG: hypothetical protein JAY75_02150, partial [Candidatus Thiodiazotropha taylori]|nr:hypothetical protein [Candidatus Thiodiazotropha taylori]MCW4307008.1 hypothetical protein [Candidatus Thiodiazotropha endolucinida]
TLQTKTTIMRAIHYHQSGAGFKDFPVYRGVSRQYGHGLGSIFKVAMRSVVPILKPLAKAGIQSAKQVAKKEGIGALRDILEGQNIKQVLKQRGKQSLKSLGKSTLSELTGGIKSKRKPKKNQSKTKRQGVKKGQKKIAGIPKNLKFPKDIFDQ